MTLLAAGADEQFLREYAETRGYSAGRPTMVRVSPDGKTAVYLRGEARDVRQRLYALDLATGQESTLLTPEALLGGTQEHLSVAERARLERMRVTARGFTSYRLSRDGQRVVVVLSGRLSLLDRARGTVTALKTGPGPAIDPTFSPDGALLAYVRNNDLYVIDLERNVERPVTKGGTEEKPNGLAEFVAQEEMHRFSGFWFSPDSKAIAFQQTDHSGVERFAISDPMHPEVDASHFYYPRAGRTNATVRLGVQALAGGPPRWIEWDATTFPYLATVKWKDGPLTLVVQNREQTREEVLEADPSTGRTKRLLIEEDAAWLNLDQSFPLFWKGHGFFWMTERNGAPEVELRNLDGTARASWVRPDAGFDKLAGFDPKGRTLFFTGGPNPTQSHLYRVTDGGAPELMTDGAEAVELALLSGDDDLLVVERTSSSAMSSTAVVKRDGERLATLPSVALEPSLSVSSEMFQLGGDAGLWAQVVRPTGFTAGTKYPVILEVYGGPHRQLVMASKRAALLDGWLANQGFIVVRADGRGTPRRGRAWERAISHDFVTTIVADQVAALQALGARIPEMDLSRVGVFGWSFGGSLAGLMGMSRGDVVKSAVLGAPVVDWRDYDTHYTERYLGLPEAPGGAYDANSLLTAVKDARRPLLLIHGTADDNVYFLHTLKLSDALFRAGKPHAVLPLTNFTHLVPDPLVTQRLWERIASFFKDTL